MPAQLLLLAQADSPVSWLSLIVATFALALLGIQHFRSEPFARKDELAALDRKIDQLLHAEGHHYEKIMEAGANRARTMYQKIDGVSDKVEGLTGRVGHIEGRLGVEIHGKD